LNQLLNPRIPASLQSNLQESFKFQHFLPVKGTLNKEHKGVFTSLQRQRALTKKIHKHLLPFFQPIKSLPQRTIKKLGNFPRFLSIFSSLRQGKHKKKEKTAFNSRESPPKTNQPSSKPVAFTTLYHHHTQPSKNQRASQPRPPPSQAPTETSLHSLMD
jgi:hypothetical protein